jgi:hypothetical protein
MSPERTARPFQLYPRRSDPSGSTRQSAVHGPRGPLLTWILALLTPGIRHCPMTATLIRGLSGWYRTDRAAHMG